jgi:hypothetical protein
MIIKKENEKFVLEFFVFEYKSKYCTGIKKKDLQQKTNFFYLFFLLRFFFVLFF